MLRAALYYVDMIKYGANFMQIIPHFVIGQNFSMLKEKAGVRNKPDQFTLQNMETNNLIALAKQGNTEAFGQIYDQFIRRIFKFVRLKIQNQQEAEDVVQETFVKAYKGLVSLKLENLNFSAWLYRIAANTINDHFRKKYRTPEITAIDETFDLPDSYSLQEEVAIHSDLEIVRDGLKILPPLYKQVLELRFLQDLSLDETAAIINKNNLSVRLIQFRALKKLR